MWEKEKILSHTFSEGFFLTVIKSQHCVVKTKRVSHDVKQACKKQQTARQFLPLSDYARLLRVTCQVF